MKKLNSFPVVAVLCSLIFLLFAGVECNETEPENQDAKCQQYRSLKVTWLHNPNEQGERLLDPASHVTSSNSVGVQFTYNVKVTEKVLCLREITAVDFYVTVKKDDTYESTIGATIILGDEPHLPVWDQSGDDERRYFHAGETVSGDPNGTNVNYELLITVTIYKNGDEETFEIVEVFDNLYEKIQIDWFFYEW